MRKRSPLHLQIADQLRQRISSSHYGPDALPPELVLMEEFGCSRHTIRSALQHLVNEGLIERRAGSGTRITDRARGGIWAIGALGDLIGEFAPNHFLTLIAREAPAADHPEAEALFALRPGAKLFYIMRLLLAEGKPYALADVYTRTDLSALVPAELLGVQPLIQLIEKHARVRSARVRQVATAAAADATVARQLGLQQGEPVLKLQRTYFDAAEAPILHTNVSCRPDRYQQVVDFVHEPPA